MANFNKFQLFRLHFSIPHKVDIKEPERRERRNEVQCEPSPNIDTMPEERVADEVVGNQEIICRQATCLPAGSLNLKMRWLMKAIGLLHEVRDTCDGKSWLEKFEIFKSKCLNENIPVRTIVAFKLKLRKL